MPRFISLSTSRSSPQPSRTSADDQDIDNDLLEARCSLDFFLDSHITDAEAILLPKRDTSMYAALGHAFILFLKSLMSFEASDIQEAFEALQRTHKIASSLRKRDLSWIGSISYLAKGYSIEDIKSMTKVQRHAELVYAEVNMLKALLGVIANESIVSFVQHGLTVRTCYQTYYLLDRYVTIMNDGEKDGRHDVDNHFKSGISFGVGVFNIMLSLLPRSVLKLAEFVGFSGDRARGMKVLKSVGGWDKLDNQPSKAIPDLQGPNEGLRRQFADLTLLLYHVVLSKLIPVTDVDDVLAERILEYNLKLYPSGVFFRYFSGRKLATQCKIDEARKEYELAIETQKGWVQLRHVCSWELGLISITQQRWEDSSAIYKVLYNESSWSKAAYLYLESLSLYMLISKPGTDYKEQLLEVAEKMKTVIESKRKIAGKSIPIEKFIARKARQFLAQENKLLLPDLEALNAFGFIDFMPRDLLLSNSTRIGVEVDRLESMNEKHSNYYDDLCLAHYLYAVIARLLLLSTKNTSEKTKMLAIQRRSLDIVLENANEIVLDHYLYYYARYENARLMMLENNFAAAKCQVEEILKARDKGVYNVGKGTGGKKKYSMENALIFRCHSCLVEIDDATRSIESSNDSSP